MKIVQLYLKVFLLKPISQKDSLAKIASFIDQVLVKDEHWKNLHIENKFKNYTYASFYPLEKDGVYQKEKVYQIMIRGLDRELMMYLAENLPKHENIWMKGLICNISLLSQKQISSIYSLTPVIVKSKNQTYWRDELTFKQFEERIRINLIKKYKYFTKEEVDENFVLSELIEITNKVPIAIPYKGIKLLGDKIQIQVSNHPTAQCMAFLSLAVGLGEINARGM